jgi:hypothetical protein
MRLYGLFLQKDNFGKIPAFLTKVDNQKLPEDFQNREKKVELKKFGSNNCVESNPYSQVFTLSFSAW